MAYGKAYIFYIWSAKCKIYNLIKQGQNYEQIIHKEIKITFRQLKCLKYLQGLAILDHYTDKHQHIE